ncbi:MAG: N-acetyltransferase [Pseudomonadota bacterium]
MSHRKPIKALPADIVVRREEAGDDQSVNGLYRSVFGPGRHVRTSYLIRQTIRPDLRVSFIAARRGFTIGAIRQTPVMVGNTPIYLLGPLAVAETAAKQGIGRALLTMSIEAARQTAAVAIVLVGDEPFYGPHGFLPAAGVVLMPGPVEAERLLMLPLGAPVSGHLQPRPWPVSAA